MLEKLVAFCAHHRWLTLAVTALLCVLGWLSLRSLPVDAIPDLSDTQVIVYSRWDRPPDILEDQVTYPIVQALLGLPKVKSVRGSTDFGYSYVYAIFEDGTDLYWARSRVLEKMAGLQGSLPEGVKTELGPDATGVGWVYQYALVDKTGGHDLAELRSLQDWHLKLDLQSVPGVAEVASVGGFVKQLQVRVDPLRLQSAGVGLLDIVRAVRAGNLEMGARVMEFSGFEYMVRGRGYLKTPEDVGSLLVRFDAKTGSALRVRDLAQVAWGSDMRRGVTDLDGEGDAVGGVVVMRHGENAPAVIARVKERLNELKASLPQGVEFLTVYDRSELIHRAISTITHELLLEMLIVAMVILLFLWHIPSALIPIVTLPVAVLLAFIPMKLLGVSANIMSLAGIAVAIGAMVDASIVVVENSHKRLEQWAHGGRKGDFESVLIRAIQEVARPSFYSLMIIAVSFLPVFALSGQAGRLFHPLAFTKNLSMMLAAVLAVTLDPAMRLAFIRLEPFKFKNLGLTKLANAVLVGKTVDEEQHPVSRFLFKYYHPVVDFVLAHPKKVIYLAFLVLVFSVPINVKTFFWHDNIARYLGSEGGPWWAVYPVALLWVWTLLRSWKSGRRQFMAVFALLLVFHLPFPRFGSEFMPPLDEGDLLYMPTALPGMSASEAGRILQKQDAILKSFPQVQRVFGKAGRAETSTDVAPFSMVETTVMLKPRAEWPEKKRWYSALPDFLDPLFRWAWDNRQSTAELTNEMGAALRFAGIPNIWTMPIRNRVDMLSTGVRTSLGIKVLGSDLEKLQTTGEQIEALLHDLPGTRSVTAERAAGGYFLDVDWDREALGRYGLNLEEAQMTLAASLGGDSVSTLVLGRERYGVGVRYKSELRDSVDDVKRILLTPSDGAAGMGGGGGVASRVVALGSVAKVRRLEGPAMLRNEDGKLAAYVYVDVDEDKMDLGSYAEKAKKVLDAKLKLPEGVSLRYSGQLENMRQVRSTLLWVIPLTLALVVLLLYLNSHSWTRTAIVLLAVPFSLIGAVWLLWALGYHMSAAVWVGLIALAGLDAETGMFMLLYLEMAHDDAKAKGKLKTEADLKAAIHVGAVKRVRPKVMTVATAFCGLLPVMLATGSGADVMKRIAAPMVGGLASSFLLELIVYPGVYYLWKWKTEMEPKALRQAPRGFWAFVAKIG